MFVNALVHDREEAAAEDRFGQGVPDGGKKRPHFVDVEAGDDYDALERVGVVDAEVLHHGDAVALRQDDVEEHGIVALTAEAVERFIAIAGDCDVVTFCFEESP